MVSLLLAALAGPVCDAHPVFALRPVASAARVARAGSGYQAAAQLHFTVTQRSRPFALPTDAGLRAHIEGHRTIAERIARSSADSVRAAGASAAQARTRLHDAIARIESDLAKELDREEHVYDTVTENGAAQSQGPMYGFPGGPDARDTCLPR